MVFIKNKQTRALIIIMCALVLFGVLFAHLYYSSVNNSIDPRIVKARTLYEKYNEYAVANQFDSLNILFDSIENIYNNVKHYNNSYEIGVLYNNRSAMYLTQALYHSNRDTVSMDSLILLSEASARKSISLYENWLAKYKGQNEFLVDNLIAEDFYDGLELYNDNEKQRFFDTRKQEIKEALIENERRLSVSYTNLGIGYRHKEMYDSAAILYKKAVDLWDQNMTARNNLNILLGHPMEKRSLIEKLFPPEKN